MATTQQTARLVISDFSPGIFADFHASQAETPANTVEGALPVLGAATIENTFRCGSDRTGALVPLPKLAAGPIRSLPAGNWVTSRQALYLLDGMALTDLYVETEVPAVVADRAAVLTMYGGWFETDLYRWTVWTRLHRLFDDGNNQDLMYAKGDSSILSTETTKAHVGAGNFAIFRAQSDAVSAFTYQSVAWCVFGAPDFLAVEPAWVSGAMSATDQGLTDFDTNNGATHPASASGRILGLFPDYDNIATAQSKFLSQAGMTAASIIAVHQGRLIAAGREHGDFGENTAGETIGLLTEHIHYTPPYDFDASLEADAELTFGTFGERKPHLSGVVAAVTADELLLIKFRDGGLLIRSDLDDPTVVDLPFIHPTGGARCIPAWSPLGLIYGGRAGVYLWAGGETTELVSPQLDGWFWNPQPDIERYGTHGRFAWWEPYVVAPNNYLLDSRSRAWWRLDETGADGTNVPLIAADVGPNGETLYVFPCRLDSDNTVQWFTAERETLADTYSWQSQPIAQTNDRFVEIRELRLFATHVGTSAATVTVTISGFDDQGDAITPVATAFTLDASTPRPQLRIKPLSVPTIAYMQVRIEADSGNTSQPAPKIHSLSVAVADRQHIPSR